MSTETPTIEVQNLGPIKDLTIRLESPGVTVLDAPNGSGKSILLDGLATAASGKGKLPLRDNAKKGRLEAFGAKVTIGATTRHGGEFEAVNLEGRFDLALLVDPGMKSPVSADARRIKALIHLLEVKANPDLFRSDPAFGDFKDIVKPESLEADDPVEMARRIKGDYDEHARIAEANAEQAIGMARAAEDAAGEIDVSLPHDESELRAAYNNSRDEWQRLRTKRESWVEMKLKATVAQERLTTAEQTVDVAAAEKAAEEAADRVEEIEQEVAELRAAVVAVEQKLGIAKLERARNSKLFEFAQASAEVIESARAEVSQFEAEPETTPEQVAQAAEQSDNAAEAMDAGTRIRAALEHKETSALHRFTAKNWRIKAEQLRDASSATDDVLSRAIACDSLAVRMVGGQQRLVVTDHPRREDVGQLPYSELSHGERWRIAIDLAADQVGEGGLIVIPQEAWEGLDMMARASVHKHATERGVYALTASASQGADREMAAGVYSAGEGR